MTIYIILKISKELVDFARDKGLDGVYRKADLTVDDNDGSQKNYLQGSSADLNYYK